MDAPAHAEPSSHPPPHPHPHTPHPHPHRAPPPHRTRARARRTRVSAALGVDERDVAVQDQDSEDIFYRVVVKRVDSGLVQFLNGQSGLQLLNAHASRFDATLFLARAAALVTTASGAQKTGPSTNSLTSSKSGSMSSHH